MLEKFEEFEIENQLAVYGGNGSFSEEEDEEVERGGGTGC